MELVDVDSGLLESIQNMTANDLEQLQADAETSSGAGQLRAMMACVEQFAHEAVTQLLVA